MPSFRQDVIIAQINCYLRAEGRPEIDIGGYCHGLTLLWLHHISLDQEAQFYAFIKELVLCPRTNFKNIAHRLEYFLAKIEWLQSPEKYSTVKQFEIDKLLEGKNRIAFSAVFNVRDLLHVLEKVLLPTKMICLSDIKHTIGLYFKDDHFYLYDANLASGEAVKFNHINRLFEKIIAAFNETGRPIFKIGLTFNILDPLHVIHPQPIAQAEINSLLTKSAAKVFRSDRGITPLHLAAEIEDIESMQIVLSHKINIDATDEYNRTPLYLAADSRHPRACHMLLDAGADATIASSNNDTILHLAAILGDEAFLLRIIEKFPNVDLRNNQLMTPLHEAVTHNLVTVTQHLLAQGANPLLRNKTQCAIDIAIEKKNWLMVLVLLWQTPNELLTSKLIEKIFFDFDALIATLRNQAQHFASPKTLETKLLSIKFAPEPSPRFFAPKPAVASSAHCVDQRSDSPEPTYNFCTIL